MNIQQSILSKYEYYKNIQKIFFKYFVLKKCCYVKDIMYP